MAMDIGGFLDSLLSSDPSVGQAPPSVPQPYVPPLSDVRQQGLLSDGSQSPPTWATAQPQMMTPKQYQDNQSSAPGFLTNLFGTAPGPFRALAGLLGGDQGVNQTRYNAMLQQAQQAGIQGLGIPKQQLISNAYNGVNNGTINPATGLPYPQGQASQQSPYVPRLPGPPQGMPPGYPPQGMPQGSAPQGGGMPQGTPQPSPGTQPMSQGQPMPQGAPLPQGAAQPQGAPVNRLWGMPTAGNMSTQSALLASAAQPDVYKAYAESQWAPVRPGGYAPDASGQRQFFPQGIPGVPYSPSDPRFNQAAADFTRQQENIKGSAHAASEEAIAGNNYRLATGEPPPGGTPAGAPGPIGSGGAPMPGRAPVMSLPAGGASASAQPIVTDKGTTVPLPTAGNQTMGPGEKQIESQITNSGKTEENWNSVRPTIETSRQRLGALSDAFSQLETGGLTQSRADISNNLRGAGLGWLADRVMGAKDVGTVQSALWTGMQDVLSSLKTINAGTGGRILNSEFNAFLEHGFSPDMVGPALHNAVTQQLGTTYQVGNMIDDYYGQARPAGWRDANQYQSAYLKANPIEGFVNYANKTVPPFGGMPGGPGTPTITPENQTKAAQLRKNYQMLSKDDQTKQRDTFIKQLNGLGYK